MLESAGLRRLFPVLVCSEDVTHGKPHPEGYEKALRALSELHEAAFEPASVLVFEDSAVGLAAALRRRAALHRHRGHDRSAAGGRRGVYCL